MRKLSTIAAATTIAAMFAIQALAGPAGVGVSKPNAEPDAATIAELQEAGQQALRDGRNGNKNNAAFLRKNYEVNQLIDRLKKGDQVDPSEIDKALEPVHVP